MKKTHPSLYTEKKQESAKAKTDSRRNDSLSNSDLGTIYAAVSEYMENGYSYPLFPPGCGCD